MRNRTFSGRWMCGATYGGIGQGAARLFLKNCSLVYEFETINGRFLGARFDSHLLNLNGKRSGAGTRWSRGNGAAGPGQIVAELCQYANRILQRRIAAFELQ